MARNCGLPSTMHVSTNENHPGIRFFGCAFESIRNMLWIYLMFSHIYLFCMYDYFLSLPVNEFSNKILWMTGWLWECNVGGQRVHST